LFAHKPTYQKNKAVNCNVFIEFLILFFEFTETRNPKPKVSSSFSHSVRSSTAMSEYKDIKQLS